MMYMRLGVLLVHVQVNKPYLELASKEYSIAIRITTGVTFAIIVCIPTLCMLSYY